MKITKTFQNLSNGELTEKLEEFKKELLKLNVQVATGANTSNPGKLKQIKKNIARVLTLLQQRGSENQ